MVELGTSRAAKAPPTRNWNTVISALRSPDRNAATILNVTFSVGTSVLQTIAPVSTPIIAGISEGLKFAFDVKENGLREAVRHEALSISEKYVIPSISDGLWDKASSTMNPRFTSSPFGRLAEVAFKKTLNLIMTRGAEALAKEGE